MVSLTLKIKKKMKKYLSIFFGMAAIAFAGCEQLENNAPETDGAKMTFSAGITTEGVSTEVESKVSYADGAVKLKWKERGEKITVFFLGEDNALVGTETFNQISVSEDGKKADFEGDIPAGAAKFHCVYPAIKSDESAAGFTYDLRTQTGSYEESQTVLCTWDKTTDIVNGKPAAAVPLIHWTYIINATLDFGTDVSGTASDIVFDTNITTKKTFEVKSTGTVGSVSNTTTKGDVTVSGTPALADGKANVVIYGFGDNHIGESTFTCKVDGKTYKGIMDARKDDEGNNENCENGHQYSPVIKMYRALEFDFNSTDVFNNWPRGEQENTVKKTYLLDGTEYSFWLSGSIYINYSSNAKKTYIRINKSKSLAFPTVSGKKLVRVDVTPLSTGTSRKAQIIDNATSTSVSGDFMIISEIQKYTFRLTGTEADKVYAIKASSSDWIGLTDIVLYYE